MVLREYTIISLFWWIPHDDSIFHVSWVLLPLGLKWTFESGKLFLPIKSLVESRTQKTNIGKVSNANLMLGNASIFALSIVLSMSGCPQGGFL